MTNKPREETGRKFVSDYFGRNKAETSTIPDDVWAFVCRKDYQRSKYASDKTPEAYRTFWMSALKTQLIRLRLWRPEALYEVKLLNRAEERLNTYNSALLQNGKDIAAAQRLVFVGPTAGKKGPIPASNADSIDPIQAQHIKTNFSGMRTIDYILDTIHPWIESSLRSGALTRMPPIEFLIQDPVDGDTINKPSKNYQMWLDFLEPKWSEADEEAALALMALNKQPLRPMNLTWEAHHAAVAEDAAKRAAEDAARGPTVGAASTASTATTTAASPIHTTESDRPTAKGKGKRRMVDEDEQPATSGLLYNGRNTAGKKRKVEPKAAPVSAPAPLPLPAPAPASAPAPAPAPTEKKRKAKPTKAAPMEKRRTRSMGN